jgi:hypothetical protein
MLDEFQQQTEERLRVKVSRLTILHNPGDHKPDRVHPQNWTSKCTCPCSGTCTAHALPEVLWGSTPSSIILTLTPPIYSGRIAAHFLFFRSETRSQHLGLVKAPNFSLNSTNSRNDKLYNRASRPSNIKGRFSIAVGRSHRGAGMVAGVATSKPVCRRHV